jgi:hypothetical protein
MIQRGYLTMEHIAELLRGDPKGPPSIFGPETDFEISRNDAAQPL